MTPKRPADNLPARGVTVDGESTVEVISLGAAQLAILGEGDVTVTADATDDAGNVSPTANASFTLDTITPDAPSIDSWATDTNITDDGITSDNTLTLSVTGEPGGTPRLYVDNAHIEAQGDTDNYLDGTTGYDVDLDAESAGNEISDSGTALVDVHTIPVNDTGAAISVTVDAFVTNADGTLIDEDSYDFDNFGYDTGLGVRVTDTREWVADNDDSDDGVYGGDQNESQVTITLEPWGPVRGFGWCL